MIESSIASNHYYYVFFFAAPKIKTLSSIPDLFDFEADHKIISSDKNRQWEFCHFQLELDKMYGSEAVLVMNKSKKKENYYWYDFYVGKIELEGKKYYYTCYPYSKLGKFLERSLREKSIQPVFYKPDLQGVLDYMKTRNNTGLSVIENAGFSADIVRYSGEVTEDETQANRVNIIGANPLKSKTYEILSRPENEIGIVTISLKLKCKQEKIGDIELSFDRLGNYRFWLRKFAQDTSIPVIPYAFKFLMEIAPLESSNFISQNTLLENE